VKVVYLRISSRLHTENPVTFQITDSFDYLGIFGTRVLRFLRVKASSASTDTYSFPAEIKEEYCCSAMNTVTRRPNMSFANPRHSLCASISRPRPKRQAAWLAKRVASYRKASSRPIKHTCAKNNVHGAPPGSAYVGCEVF